LVVTLAVVATHLIILAIIGWAALSVVARDLRLRLLPAAPVFGAALIAVITCWTTRWMSITQALSIILLVPLVMALVATRRARESGESPPWQIPWSSVRDLLAGAGACVGGVVLASIPVVVAGDTNIVSPTGVPDGLYFAEVSTWLVDNPMLPGPTVNSPSWPANDPPAAGAAADTVVNNLRYGQSSVAAFLAVMTGQSPYTTLVANSLLWLVLLGMTMMAAGSLLGVNRWFCLLAAFLASNLFFVASQTLNGQNDGLLGSSIALLSIVLSARVLEDTRAVWPAVLTAAGLFTVYYEFATMVLPAVAMLTLLGPVRTLLHRVNLIGVVWATSAALVPWAWIWAARSLATTSRLSSGQSAFEGKSDWSLLRTYAGVATFTNHERWNVVLGAVALVGVLATGVGLTLAVLAKNTRGMTIGGVGAFLVLQTTAAMQGSTNLQYRVIQLGLPLLVLFAAKGWHALWKLSRPAAGSHRRTQPVAARRRVPITVLVATLTIAAPLALGAANFATVAMTTSHERARTQHIPAEFTRALQELADEVGGSEITVLTPSFPDAVGMSLALTEHPDVLFATVPYPGITQVGSMTWDRHPDRYYALGRGVRTFGDVQVVAEVGAYRVVTLGESGTIVAPFGSEHWQRLTLYGRGLCAAPQARLLVIRGSEGRQRLKTWTYPNVLQLFDEAGQQLDSRTARKGDESGSTPQVFDLPTARSFILTIVSGPPSQGDGTYWSMLGFTAKNSDRDPLDEVSPEVMSICLSGIYNGVDGYDREVFTMTSPY
jgi:hypothetical protein